MCAWLLANVEWKASYSHCTGLDERDANVLRGDALASYILMLDNALGANYV